MVFGSLGLYPIDPITIYIHSTDPITIDQLDIFLGISTMKKPGKVPPGCQLHLFKENSLHIQIPALQGVLLAGGWTNPFET